MNRTRFEEILNGYRNVRIAVVGDYFLDKWLHIDSGLTEKSIETGLDAYQVTRKRTYAGAAGTVCSNLAALGVGQVISIGFIGDDGEGYDVVRSLEKMGANTDMMHISEQVMTPTYTKPLFMIDGDEREGNRFDHKNTALTPAELEDLIIRDLQMVVENVDAIIVLDQLEDENKGVVTERVRQAIAQLADQYPDVIMYADSRKFLHKFDRIMVKCNNLELLRMEGLQEHDPWDMSALQQAMQSLAKKNGRAAFVTCGPQGVLAMDDGCIQRIETIPQDENAIDIVGAGDACTSGIVSTLCTGATNAEAAYMGNMVSSITIQQIGTTGTATPEQMRSRFDEISSII